MPLPNKYLKTEEKKKGGKEERWIIESAYVLEIQLVL